MSSPVEITIIANGTERTSRNSYGGDTFARMMFWGPEEVLRYAIDLGQEEGQPLLIGEGAAVIDIDRRIVLWFGGPYIDYEPDARRVFRTLMARNWPGWQERWADGENDDLHDYLGWLDFTGSPLALTLVRQPNRGVGNALEPAERTEVSRHLSDILTMLRADFAYPVEDNEELPERERRIAFLAALEREFLP